MRKLSLSILAIGLMLPATASAACPNWANSTIVPACENGVKVYRGTPHSAPAVPIVIQDTRASDRINEQRLALQNERLAAQAERINGLESQLDEANRPRSRSRYGRRYYAPIGAFGGRRSYGRRGFNGRGYGRRGYGGSRSSGIKVTYNRRRL